VLQLWKERTFRKGIFPAKEGMSLWKRPFRAAEITSKEENPEEELSGNEDPEE